MNLRPESPTGSERPAPQTPAAALGVPPWPGPCCISGPAGRLALGLCGARMRSATLFPLRFHRWACPSPGGA